MQKVIIDTNVLMAISQFNLDIFSELIGYKVHILSGTKEELEKIIKEQRGKFKVAANVALKLLDSKNVQMLKSSGDVDDALVEYSKKGYLVLTQDIGLKRRLVKPYLTIRQKKKVVRVG